MSGLKHETLTGEIIACAIAVHKGLGPGFIESIYETALVVELQRTGLSVEEQKAVPIYYREKLMGEHRLDLLVENLVVIELKAISELLDIHFAIGRSYLKATGLEHGLLLNFATMPLTIRRISSQPRSALSRTRKRFLLGKQEIRKGPCLKTAAPRFSFPNFLLS
jgi:GxxExxY protein